MKNEKIWYPTVDGIVETNRAFVNDDTRKIKEQLMKSNLSEEEKGFLERLLKKKEGLLSMDECVSIEKEGEVWFKRKDKNFDLDYDVLTD